MFSKSGELLFQTVFENGTGYYNEFYNENNQLFLYGELLNGKREGRWKTYYKSGAIKYVKHYKDDLLNGKYTYYDEQGNILYDTEFSDGTGWLKLFDPKTLKIAEEGQMEKGYRIGL